jgi:hypothetical protein
MLILLYPKSNKGFAIEMELSGQEGWSGVL